MKRLFIAAAAATLVGGSSFAVDFNFLGGTMDGPEAGTSSGATGVEFAEGIVYTPENNTLSFNFDIFNLEGTFQGVELRGPAAVGQPGALITTLGAGGSGPDYFVTPDSQTPIVLSDQQETDLNQGELYLIVATLENPGPNGEIRGQLVPVPEPQTYAMIGGLALLGFAGYRRFKGNTAVTQA